ncbi:MAG: tetratricopeptide repeat protein [Bacteroidia bacterium]|jgi:tetratricopeptide (TPR) repeat protein
MKYRLIAAALLFAGALQAQQAKVVSAINALGYYQKDKSDIESLQKGRGFIEEAIGAESTQGKPKTWWVRGNIYLAIQESKNDVLVKEAGGEPLLIAAESYQKAFELDAKYENAADCYQKALIAYKNLGIMAFNAKEFNKSTDYFERVVTLSSKAGAADKDGIQNTAVAAMNAGNYDKAIQYYSMMLDQDTSGSMYAQVYKAFLAKGDTAQGIAKLDEGRVKFPKNQALLTEKLNHLFRQQRNAEAEQLLKLAIENDPTNHTLYLAAGSTYESLGRMEEAIAAYKKAIEIKPEAWQAYYNLGAYYNNKGKELQDAANNEKDNKKYEAGIKAADAQLQLALENLEKAKELTQVGSADRMDIMRALKQLYVRLNLTDKFEAIKKEMQQ